jgi:probable addiction module antidote protein
MPEEKFTRYDSADYLKTEEDIAAYLEAVMEEGGDDPAYVTRALGVVARARNMTALAREVGMSRVGLSKALSEDGNPTLSTVMKVAKVLGLKIAIQPERMKARKA